MPRTDWSQGWMEYHTLDDPCNHQKWCRLHWWPTYMSGEQYHERYPLKGVNIPSSRHGWQRVIVACGPGAFLPKKVK